MNQRPEKKEVNQTGYNREGSERSKPELADSNQNNTVILDIRSPEEEEDNPLMIEDIEVNHIPFFKLLAKFGALDQKKTYLLYCGQGVMSRLHALFLREKGYDNVGVYHFQK